MTQLVLAVLVVVLAAAVAEVVRRRRPTDAPTQRRHHLPEQLDRTDFVRADAPWLVVVFSSATCSTCADVIAKVGVLESPDVAVHVVSYQERRDLHDKYRIDSVPGLVIADGDGVTRSAFLGPVTATDLWAAVAAVRDPSVRLDARCDHHEPTAEPGR